MEKTLRRRVVPFDQSRFFTVKKLETLDSCCFSENTFTDFKSAPRELKIHRLRSGIYTYEVNRH